VHTIRRGSDTAEAQIDDLSDPDIGNLHVSHGPINSTRQWRLRIRHGYYGHVGA
jgi:hypothetical protein